MSQQRLDTMDSTADRGDADFSPCGRYRYKLWRQWGERGISGDGVLWVMLNPSTADARKDDATVRRCTSFSRAWGAHKLTIVNCYALISTDPAELYRAEDPVGPDNDATIAFAAREASAIVVAWGNHAPHPARAETVTDILRVNSFYAQRLYCLSRTKGGHPRHPVRLAASTKREVFYG